MDQPPPETQAQTVHRSQKTRAGQSLYETHASLARS